MGGVAAAQTAALQVTLHPALFEEELNPGDTFSTSVTVTNPEPTTNKFTVGVQDISGLKATGEPIFTSSTVPNYGVSSWVNIGTPTITVPPNGSVNVPFTITVPKDAAPGGHYGAIFVNYGASRPAINGSGIGYQVGSLIEIRIAGNANEAMEVQQFSTDKSLYQSPNVNFTAVVANQGNVLLQPRGPIDITNMFGQKVGSIVMNDNNDSVFPGQNRSFTANWTGSGFMFGQFTASMALAYGDNGARTTAASLSFWIIPIVPIIAVLASIIFFVSIFVWSIRAYVRKRVNTMTGRRGTSLTAEEKFLMENRLPFSRLLFIVIVTVVFALIFLIALFLLFG